MQTGMIPCDSGDSTVGCGMFFRRAQLLVSGLLTVAFLLHAGMGHARDRALTVVFEDYPPYEYVENNQVKGVNMDLIREAFERMGVTASFEPRPWKRALFELEEGDILALSSGFRTAEREHFAIFPSEPLAMEVNVVAVLADAELEVESLEDLKGVAVGVVREYVYGHEFDSFEGVRRIETNSMYQLVDMLLNRRMPAIVGNATVIRHIAKKRGQLSRIKFVYEIGREPLYLFFSRKRGEQARQAAREFGATIRSMRKDGTFSDILSRY